MAATAAAVSASLCGGSGPQAHHHLALARPLPAGGRVAARCRRQRLATTTTVLAAARKPPGEAEEQVPAWARPGSDEPPPWEREGGAAKGTDAGQIPFYAYLLASAVTAIAAIGSIFEYTNQKPVFGIIGADSALYSPLLGFFVFTGIPTSAFLWFKAVQTANREAEEQDRRDGFM